MGNVTFDALDSPTVDEKLVGVGIWGRLKTDDATILLPKAHRSKNAEYIDETVDDRQPLKKREEIVGRENKNKG